MEDFQPFLSLKQRGKQYTKLENVMRKWNLIFWDWDWEFRSETENQNPTPYWGTNKYLFIFFLSQTQFLSVLGFLKIRG